jgi:gluconokinase
MTADLFGSTVVVPEVFEASAFGAAALAMYAVGEWSSLDKVEQIIGDSAHRSLQRYKPNLDNAQRYGDLFKIYRQLYENQVDLFQALVTVRGQD